MERDGPLILRKGGLFGRREGSGWSQGGLEGVDRCLGWDVKLKGSGLPKFILYLVIQGRWCTKERSHRTCAILTARTAGTSRSTTGTQSPATRLFVPSQLRNIDCNFPLRHCLWLARLLPTRCSIFLLAFIAVAQNPLADTPSPSHRCLELTASLIAAA
jgi:hypothetical protein